LAQLGSPLEIPDVEGALERNVEGCITSTVGPRHAIALGLGPVTDEGAVGPDTAVDPEPVTAIETRPLLEVQNFNGIVQPLPALRSAVLEPQLDPGIQRRQGTRQGFRVTTGLDLEGPTAQQKNLK
jgi:hypothetical protein